MSNKNSTLHALKWSTLGHILPQVVSPLIAIYIARLLCPEAYGIIAIASIVISFLQIFLARGFTTALIQKQGNQKEINRTADFIFSFNLIISILFYLIILFSSSAIAQFFHNPDAKLVISILSFSLVIRAFGDVQLAMLQKNMDFKSIFYRQIVPIGSQLIVTLPLASLGYGVWALVTGKLVSDILATIILWWKSEWKPRFNFSFKEHIDIISFSLFVILESLIGWGTQQGDNLIVGKFLTIKELGIYKTGFDLDIRIFSLLTAPLIPVFYSKLCTLDSNENKIKYYKKIKEYIGILVFPVIFGMILISGYFDNLILGEKWKGVSFVLAVLAINPGISFLWALTPSFLKSIGKPKKMTLLAGISLFIFIPTYYYAIKFGFKTFVIVRACLGIVGVVSYTYFENREMKINFYDTVKFYYKPFLASIVMFFVGYSFRKYVFNIYSFSSLILLIVLSSTVYFSVILILAKQQLLALKSLIFKRK